jgi:hypothetical protein
MSVSKVGYVASDGKMINGPEAASGTRIVSATSSTTNPTWPDLASNPDSHDGNPATNRLNYDTACVQDAIIVSEEKRGEERRGEEMNEGKCINNFNVCTNYPVF